MSMPVPPFRPLPLYAKVIALVLIAGFVVIGIIGILLPVIPGVLFLFLAALMATRVSRRASAAAHASPWFREQLRQWRASSHLSVGHKIKLSLLIVARAFVGTIRAGLGLLRRVSR